ncbi:IclR family transcriptional regulator [Psychrobacter sp. NZS113]|uniref:IclR family transcriptional regulator n=1 Tax=Psychrobacter sp. NZS113 TaxID=2792045 RepID=UPI0018CD21C1|nr:IclR family transcriptional regulator [Psychrobacter sp. NZS113]MBH0095768.1 IclR family transcriptional regulator [Psychrobacter sp. NZS113]
MSESLPNDKYMVNSLKNGLLLMELFNNSEIVEMSLSEVAAELGINKSSAYRLLFTLEQMGYIKKDSNKNYMLDIKVVDLSHSYLTSISFKHEAYAVMEKLRDDTGTAVHLFTLDGTEIVNLQNIQPLSSFISNILPGLRWPAYATVIGQMLLSDLPNEEIERRFHNFSDWKVYSDATPTNIDELLKLVDQARGKSHLTSWQKFNNDMVACTAPVKDLSSNKIVYSLSVSFPVHAFTLEYFEEHITPSIVNSANNLSKIYKPDGSW